MKQIQVLQVTDLTPVVIMYFIHVHPQPVYILLQLQPYLMLNQGVQSCIKKPENSLVVTTRSFERPKLRLESCLCTLSEKQSLS